MDKLHYPVMLNECMEGLKIRPDGVYVDGTLGMGGHSEAILERLTQGGTLISVDRDEIAIERARVRLSAYADRHVVVHGNFRDTAEILKGLGYAKVDGMLFDLGVSSPQLDEAERGFSYMADASLDMRMDKSDSLDAWQVVNTWPKSELLRIIRDYGEERYAQRIATAIERRREQAAINSTAELVDVIRSAMPAAALREKQHPAKRTFQGIRIAVNDELSAVEDMMETVPDSLNVGGRLAVISFHSLEDRIVKRAIRSREDGCSCPREVPVCVCGFKSSLKSIGRRPLVASEAELSENPRSRSAKLRVAERI